MRHHVWNLQDGPKSLPGWRQCTILPRRYSGSQWRNFCGAFNFIVGAGVYYQQVIIAPGSWMIYWMNTTVSNRFEVLGSTWFIFFRRNSLILRRRAGDRRIFAFSVGQCVFLYVLTHSCGSAYTVGSNENLEVAWSTRLVGMWRLLRQRVNQIQCDLHHTLASISSLEVIIDPSTVSQFGVRSPPLDWGFEANLEKERWKGGFWTLLKFSNHHEPNRSVDL